MVSLTRLALGFAVFSAVGTQLAPAQLAISGQAGLIHYTEGKIFLNDQLIEPKFGEFAQMKDGQQLRTEEGRVEVLLSPGIFLRLGENSALRMVNNQLVDTRLELLSGEALLQVDEIIKGDSLVVTYRDYAVQFLKAGVYRLTSEPEQLRVYNGEASVDINGETKVVKDGHSLTLASTLQEAKFDKNDVDDLYKWSRLRSQYIAMANVSSAKTMLDSGAYQWWWQGGVWDYNPFFGMYTFIPFGGMYYDPWGFAFWSPFTIDSYLGTWPVYYTTGGSGSGSSSGSKPIAHHPPARVHPTPRNGYEPKGVPRGVSIAAAAQHSVSRGSGSHAGGLGGSAAHVGGSSFSGGGSLSAGSAHSGGGGSSGSSSGGGGSHK